MSLACDEIRSVLPTRMRPRRRTSTLDLQAWPAPSPPRPHLSSTTAATPPSSSSTKAQTYTNQNECEGPQTSVIVPIEACFRSPRQPLSRLNTREGPLQLYSTVLDLLRTIQFSFPVRQISVGWLPDFLTSRKHQPRQQIDPYALSSSL